MAQGLRWYTVRGFFMTFRHALGLLSLAVFALSAAPARADQADFVPGKTQVLWFNPQTQKWVSSGIRSIDPNSGKLQVWDHVYGEHSHGDQRWEVPASSVARELEDRGGIAKDEKRCLNSRVPGLDAGTRVSIERVFTNQKAEVKESSVFSFFLSSYVVDLSQLGACGRAEAAKVSGQVQARADAPEGERTRPAGSILGRVPTGQAY